MRPCLNAGRILLYYYIKPGLISHSIVLFFSVVPGKVLMIHFLLCPMPFSAQGILSAYFIKKQLFKLTKAI
jgi:hypothetical protein